MITVWPPTKANTLGPVVSEPETSATNPEPSPSSALEADHRDHRSPVVFTNLDAPRPAVVAPPPGARWLAFALTVLAGLLAGVIGYGVGDLLGRSTTWAGTGALVGAIIGALGVGIVSNLTLQAMAEWRSIEHPEAGDDAENPGPDAESDSNRGRQ